jgi:integrase
VGDAILIPRVLGIIDKIYGTVLAALKGRSLYPIVALAVSTGARRGELLALRWSDFDAERGVLRIERSVEETKDGGLRNQAAQDKARCAQRYLIAGRRSGA